MEYQVNAGSWGSLFAVPNCVVDHFLKLAPPNALKVLLYVLRHNDQALPDAAIAAALSLPQEAVEEAFSFWEQANVLTRAASAPEPTPQPQTSSPQPTPSPVAATVPTPAVTEQKSYVQRTSAGFAPTPSELAARIDAEQPIRALYDMAERTFGRMLNHTEQRSLLWMYDYLGLNSDVILMLIGYCVSIQKAHVRYMETIAVDWQEHDICTLAAAQAEVQRLTAQRSFTAQIMRLFDMKHRPVSRQQEFIDLWQQKGYPVELIGYAYEKTIEAIDKLSFPYIAKVLETWDQNGLRDREAVDRFQGQRITENEEHSYRLDEYKSLVNNFPAKL